MEILTKENLVGAKIAPTAVSRTFTPLLKGDQVSLVRTFLSDPGSERKISRLGGWGWKNDSENQKLSPPENFDDPGENFSRILREYAMLFLPGLGNFPGNSSIGPHSGTLLSFLLGDRHRL